MGINKSLLEYLLSIKYVIFFLFVLLMSCIFYINLFNELYFITMGHIRENICTALIIIQNIIKVKVRCLLRLCGQGPL